MSEANALIKIDDNTSIAEKPVRRTRRYAEICHPDLAKIPFGTLHVISDENYAHGFSWDKNDFAYIQKLKPELSVEIRDWTMYVGGVPIGTIRFEDMFTRENLVNIDISVMRALFSIIFYNLREDLDKVSPIDPDEDEQDTIHRLNEEAEEAWRKRRDNSVPHPLPITHSQYVMYKYGDLYSYSKPVYLPDIMEYIGIKNYSAEQMEILKTKIKEMAGVLGIVEFATGNKHDRMTFQLMVYNEEEDTNCIYLHSPYMNKLVERILRNTNHPLYQYNNRRLGNKKGTYQFKPPVTTMLDPAINRERNKRAIEVVYELVVLLENAKTMTPNIKVSTLKNACYGLKTAYDEAGFDTSLKNKILKRTFTAVWKYLKKYSDAYERFEIEDFIPTDRTIDHLLEFPSKNKSADK